VQGRMSDDGLSRTVLASKRESEMTAATFRGALCPARETIATLSFGWAEHVGAETSSTGS